MSNQVNFVTKTTLQAVDQTRSAFAAMQKNAKQTAMQFRSVQQVARGFKSMGRQMSVGIAAPTVAAGANALRMGLDFETAMNNTQSKLLVSKEAMKALRDQAKEMGSTTAFSASQAANAQGFLAQAGFNAKQIIGSLPATLDLAAAANMDLAGAADIASNVLGAFKMQSADASINTKNYARVVNVLALASARSNTSVEELAEGFKDAAPVAAGFGMDIEQTSAMLGMLANMGIKGSKSGMVMKNMLGNLASPASSARKALDALNIKQSDLFNKTASGQVVFKGVANMLQMFKKNGAGASEMLKIFGKEAGPGMIAVGDSAKAIEFLEKQLHASGSAAQMAKIQMQGLPGVWKSLKSAWEAINISFVESGVFEPLIKGAKALTKQMQTWAKANPDTLKALGRIAVVAAVAAPALIAVGATLASVTAIATFSAGAFALLSAATLPLVAALGAVGAAGYALYKHWDQVGAYLKGVWWGMKQQLMEFANAPFFKNIKKLGKQVAVFFKPFIAAKKTLSQSRDQLNQLTVSGVKLGKMLGNVVPVVGSFVAALVAIKGVLIAKAALLGVAAAIKVVTTAMVANPIVAAVSAIAGAAYLIYKNWAPIKGFFVSLWRGVETTFSNAFNSIKSGIYAAWKPVGRFFTDLWGGVKQAFSSASAFINSLTLDDVTRFITDGLVSTITFIPNLFLDAAISIKNNWSIVESFFSGVWIGIKNGVAGAVGYVTERIARLPALFVTAVVAIKDNWNSIVESIKSGFSAFYGFVYRHITEFPVSVVNAGKQAVDYLIGIDLLQIGKNIIQSLIDGVSERVERLVKIFTNIGENIMQGLISGVKSMTKSAVASVGEAADEIAGKFKSLLGIRSPSTVFAGFGVNTLQGWVNGVQQMRETAVKSIGGVSDAIANAFNPKLAANAPEFAKMDSGLLSNLLDSVQPLRVMVSGFDTSSMQKFASETKSMQPLMMSSMQGLSKSVADSFNPELTANAPVFSGVPKLDLAALNGVTLPTIVEREIVPTIASLQQEARLDADITIRVESADGLRVVNTGVETSSRGDLIRNVGVAVF